MTLESQKEKISEITLWTIYEVELEYLYEYCLLDNKFSQSLNFLFLTPTTTPSSSIY